MKCKLFCKHKGSWTYDKHNPKLRVCLECGWVDNGWMKIKGRWVERWRIPNRK